MATGTDVILAEATVAKDALEAAMAAAHEFPKRPDVIDFGTFAKQWGREERAAGSAALAALVRAVAVLPEARKRRAEKHLRVLLTYIGQDKPIFRLSYSIFDEVDDWGEPVVACAREDFGPVEEAECLHWLAEAICQALAAVVELASPETPTAPSWVTLELIEETLDMLQERYTKLKNLLLSPSHAVEMCSSVAGLMDSLFGQGEPE